jgi:sulfite exporter TauE/SafE/copper chaperone CopZ/plastocyanin domain-containing protein
LKTRTIRIGGMTCVNCQRKIEKKLQGTAGIEAAVVDFGAGTATVSYDAALITFDEIEAVIEKLDYTVLDERGSSPKEARTQIAGTLVIIIALYMLMRQFGVSAMTSAFPLAEAGMGYGMLFVIGLITSVHCVAMCGGINLSQTLGGEGRTVGERAPDKKTAALRPSLLYNGGRVISYTIIGVIVGALGSVLTVSGRFQGVIQLAAGVFMVIMGINMLGIFPWLRRFNLRIPKIFANKIDEQKSASKNPLFIGLLNGLMPCGPLQAMQLYALSTGSPIAGGVSMFLFSMGTVPLMFGIGALSSLLSKKFTAQVMKIGAILVTVLGLTMFTNGWSLGGLPEPIDTFTAFITPVVKRNYAGGGAENTGKSPEPLIENGAQIINSTLSGGRYPAITVRQGIPVKWTINAPQGSINGCNNRMIIREYGIEHTFKTGENVIEFMPVKSGKFSYSCWMGMIRSSITVVADGESMVADEGGGIGSSNINPIPAGVSIPTDELAIAEIEGENEFQSVIINLGDEGFSPSILVVQRNIPAAWVINNDSLDPGNNQLIVSAYRSQFDTQQGENIIQFMPQNDFDFSTGDSVFYGYVKVVEDINAIDVEAIKREIGDWETLIYPPAYFDAVSQAAGCCN